MPCQFYSKDRKVCLKDSCFCPHGEKDDEFLRKYPCPTMLAIQRGEFVGGTPASPDYVGVEHVVRQGVYGAFSTGKPFEYLRGDLRHKQNEQNR
jgi:hypothetical protein